MAKPSAGPEIPEEPRRDPRFNQRLRTRRAVLIAAQELVKAGHTPTVPEAADAALVSRATAYRYFPTQAALLVEAVMLPSLPTAESVFGRPGAPRAAADRVALVSDLVFDLIHSMEREFRLVLREQLAPSSDGQQHPSLWRPLIDAALEPITPTLDPAVLNRLRNALGVLIGTGAVVACRDVLHLDGKTARITMSWACRALVQSETPDSGKASVRSRAGHA